MTKIVEKAVYWLEIKKYTFFYSYCFLYHENIKMVGNGNRNIGTCHCFGSVWSL